MIEALSSRTASSSAAATRAFLSVFLFTVARAIIFARDAQASELLLPSEMVGLAVRERSASFSTAKRVADTFYTSITATAMKCVEVAPQPCAFIISDGGVVIRFKPNTFFNRTVSVGRSLGFGYKSVSFIGRLGRKSGQRFGSGSRAA